MNRIGIGILLMLGTVCADRLADAIDKLKSTDSRELITGARMVKAMGPKGKRATPYLVKNLGHGSGTVRKEMQGALVRIDANAALALVKGLKKYKDLAHRREIAATLVQIGAGSEKQAGNLIKALNEPDEITRHRIAETLARHGRRTVKLLVKALGARSANARDGAAWALGRRGEAVVPMLRTATTDKSPQRRSAAVLALGYSNPVAKDALVDVRKLLTDPEHEVRAAAAKALSRLGKDSSQAVNDLIRTLGDDNRSVRHAAIASLVRMGDSVAEALVKALAGKNRAAARAALVGIGRDAFQATEDGLKSKSAIIREGCMRAFGEAIVIDRPPLDGMGQLFKDPVAAVRRATTVALGLRRPSGWSSSLITAGKDADASVREAAMQALARAQPTEKILAAIRVGASDKDPAVRLAAEAALWNFGEPSKVLALATAHLAGTDARLRDAACVALRPMGRAAVSAIPALVAATPNRVTVDALGAITAAHGRGLIGRAARYAKAPRATQKSIDAALAWLAAVQDTEASGVHERDGRWDAANFEVHRRGEGQGFPLYNSAVTGLAVCSFLAVGKADNNNVREGLAFIIKGQDAGGSLANRRSQHFQIAHAFALVAVCEGWIVTGDPNCRRAAQLGLDFSAACRNPDLGWRYDPRGKENDTNVTVAMLHAFSLAERGGLEVDPNAFIGGGRLIKSMTDGMVGYNSRGGWPARPAEMQDAFPIEQTGSMTAAGIWGMDLAERHGVTPPDFKAGLKLCRSLPPLWRGGRLDMYFWHYGTLMFHSRQGKDWNSWNKGLTKALLANQSTDRNAGGSWAPAGPWGKDGGRIYSTALMCLSLATPYRWAPQYWKVKPAGPYAEGADALAVLAKSKDPEIAERAALWILRAGG